MSTALTLSILCSVTTFMVLYRVLVLLPRRRLLPPGPEPWPIVGNALQLSMDYLYHTFKQWKLQYGAPSHYYCQYTQRMRSQLELGDMVYMTILGRETVVLNSLTVAQDLLDKRSAIYSDRPRSILIPEMYVVSSSVLWEC